MSWPVLEIPNGRAEFANRDFAPELDLVWHKAPSLLYDKFANDPAVAGFSTIGIEHRQR
jgi:hypothetical protein